MIPWGGPPDPAEKEALSLKVYVPMVQAACVMKWRDPYCPAENGAASQQGYVPEVQAASVVQKDPYSLAEEALPWHAPVAEVVCVQQGVPLGLARHGAPFLYLHWEGAVIRKELF